MPRESVTALAKKAKRAQGTLANMRAKIEEKTEVAIGSVATVGTCGVLALTRGYLNDPASNEDPLAVRGVPLDAVGGLVLHVAAGFGAFGKFATLGHGLGNGALCSYVGVKGLEVGARMKRESSTRGRTRGALHPAASRVPTNPLQSQVAA